MLVLIRSFAILVLALFGFSCSTEQMPSIVIAYAPFESIALLTIADEQNLFKGNGLNVTLRKYNTGVGALDGMLDGEADMAVGANEFPLVGKALKREGVCTIGSIAKSDFIYLIGRKDRGIKNVSDLNGKKVGT